MLPHASVFSRSEIRYRENAIHQRDTAEIVTIHASNHGISSHGIVNFGRESSRLSSLGIEEPAIRTSTGQVYPLR